MTPYFGFALGCILIQFVVIVLVTADSIKTSQANARLRIENARLAAIFDAVTYVQRGLHKKSAMTHSVDCAG